MREPAAIADSGPLIALTRINQLTLLPKLFSQVFIPPEVWREVTVKGRGLPGALEISQITWLIFQKPDPLSVEPLSILVDA